MKSTIESAVKRSGSIPSSASGSVRVSPVCANGKYGFGFRDNNLYSKCISPQVPVLSIGQLQKDMPFPEHEITEGYTLSGA